MNATAIQYIWQAIRESERSDDLSFIDTLKQSLMPQPDRSDRPDRSGVADRMPITTVAIEPRQMQQDTLPTVTLPLLSRS